MKIGSGFKQRLSRGRKGYVSVIVGCNVPGDEISVYSVEERSEWRKSGG
jgi:hypothetical protein